MSFFLRMARLGDRMFDRLRDKRAFELREDNAIDGDLSPLKGHAYAVLVTFRRSGEAVPSPVWLGLDDAGRAYIRSAANAAKVRRLRNNSRVLIAPSNMLGRPKGPAIKATGRVLPEAEWDHAEAALAAAYGAGRKAYERTMAAIGDEGDYLEITSRASSA